eukprot:gene12872-11032_t
MKEKAKEAAKHNQRFLMDAVKGECRSQGKVYALQDTDGHLHTTKAAVHSVLLEAWSKIFTGNETTVTDEFDDLFMRFNEKIPESAREALGSDVTIKEVEDALQRMNADAGTRGLPAARGGFTHELGAEDMATIFRILQDYATRMGIPLNLFVTDWQRMYDSIPIWLPLA